MASPDHPTTPEQLLSLWHENAAPWTQAVRDRSIESRRVATDQAVVDAVLATGARRVLDVGCGEGWLTRALSAHGLDVLGVDAVAPLVERARQAGDAGAGRFEVCSFAGLMDSPLVQGFDTWVCNFSLFHPDDGHALAAAAARHLNPGGALVIQTLHANATTHGAGSPDAWQPGNWGSCGSQFGEPIPWFFRSQDAWTALLEGLGFTGVAWQEPRHPQTGQALSMLVAGTRPACG